MGAWASGGIGRRARLKIWFSQESEGSIPSPPTRKSMRIAVFTDVFLEVPGGIPSSIAAQKKSLEALGHSVTVFCPGWHPEADGVEVVPSFPRLISANGAPLAHGPKRLRAWILERFPNFAEDFDIVHVHYEASCSLAGMLLAQEFGLPLVQTMHGREDMAIAVNVPHPFKTLVGTVLCWLHARFIPHQIIVAKDDYLAPSLARAKMWTLMINHANFADEVLTPSKHFADKLKHYGVSRPITVVSNGVADEMVMEFDKKAKDKSLVRKMSDDEPLRIIWNSRVSNEKRIMPFLEAVSKMSMPVELSIFGDGNALNKARRFALKHNLNAKFYGRVAHEIILSKMISQHLSATVSYGFDTQGLTLLEAEATGLPVFFVDEDMKEVVPKNSFIFSDPDYVSMARALDKLCEHPEKISEMSRVMLEHRHEVLQSAQIKKLVKVYEALQQKWLLRADQGSKD